MPGLSDYMAEAATNLVTGQAAAPALAARYLALFTTMPTSDAGTGGTEVSGNGYARPQIAGSATTNNTTASGNAVLHFSATPSWVVAGMTVNDTTAAVIPAGTTVLSVTTNTVTMSANATGGGVGNGDTIVFSAFPAASASSGTEPAVTPVTVTNGAVITFAQATGSGWGTVVGFGIYDALSGGDLLALDWLGNYPWQPCTITSASPGLFTAHAHGFSAADPVVYTAKYGGTVPTFSQSNLTGILAVVSPTTDTFTVTNASTAVNTSSSGNGSVRKIVQQPIAGNITPSFSASNFTLNVA